MKTTSRDAGWVGALCSLTGAYAIGQAIQVSNGNGDPVAFKWLAFGLASFFAAVAAGDLGRPGRWAGGLIVALGGAMALHQVWQLGSVPPAIYLRNTSYFEFMQRLGVFAALGLSLLSVKPWLGKAALPVWIGSFFVLGAWLIAKSPAPGIDVFTWTNYAIENFAKGHNPWMIDYPNPYGHTLWYAPGLADNQWYHSGYGYPPASFLLSALGYVVGGDMRWANLSCLAIAASCFFFIRGRFGAIAAVLLLATPRILFILEQAWTDVYIIGFLGLVMWSAVKWPKATPYFLGVMFAIKQYMVFVAPLALLLLPPEWTLKQKAIFFAKALGTAALITLPFGVTNPAKFISSITVSGLPFRVEALSFLSKTAVNGVPVWPVWIQLPLMVPAYLLIWWRAPRGPVGFAMGMALVMSVFFSFSKHAFCNHHFLSLGCACAALAAILSQPVSQPAPASPATS